MRRPSLVLAALLTLALGACASGGSKSASSATPSDNAAPAQRRSSTTLASDELRGANVQTVFEAVQRLRPNWMRGRGATSFRTSGTDVPNTLPAVFMDNTSLGDIGTLRQISVEQVREVQFISGPDATTRWGTGYTAGVILVLTKK